MQKSTYVDVLGITENGQNRPLLKLHEQFYDGNI